MNFTNLYSICRWNLEFISTNKIIADSVDSYFSVYNNLNFIQPSELIKIKLDDYKNEVLDYSDYTEYASHTSRYKILKNIHQENEFAVVFYNGICVLKINTLKLYAEGYIKTPEKFGSDFIPNFIIIALIEIFFKFRNIFFIHSSLITSASGNGIIIPGNSGSGKSTTAFYLVSKNFKLITDDKCFVYKKNNEILSSGLLQPVDIIKGKDDYLLKSDFIFDIPLNYTENKKRFIFTQFKPETISGETLIKTILIPKRGAKFKAEIMSKKNAFINLIQNSITPNFNINLKEHFEILNKVVENSESYSIVLDENLNNLYGFLKEIKMHD